MRNRLEEEIRRAMRVGYLDTTPSTFRFIDEYEKACRVKNIPCIVIQRDGNHAKVQCDMMFCRFDLTPKALGLIRAKFFRFGTLNSSVGFGKDYQYITKVRAERAFKLAEWLWHFTSHDVQVNPELHQKHPQPK